MVTFLLLIIFLFFKISLLLKTCYIFYLISIIKFKFVSCQLIGLYIIIFSINFIYTRLKIQEEVFFNFFFIILFPLFNLRKFIIFYYKIMEIFFWEFPQRLWEFRINFLMFHKYSECFKVALFRMFKIVL